MSKKYFGESAPCHIGPVEIVKNLYCGSESEALEMAAEPIRVDTLVPLNCLDAEIWKLGFRGEILYYPVSDYGILPDDVLDELVSKILNRLSRNIKVGLFCMGGHGRTGYVTSVVLGKLGYEDPIKYLRSVYCKKAVESNAQIRHIAEVLGKPALVKKYESQSVYENAKYLLSDRYDFYDFDLDFFLSRSERVTCGDCTHLITGVCEDFDDTDDNACKYFERR